MNIAEGTVRDKHGEDIGAKQGVYTTCFVLLCLIDQLRGSATGRVQMVAANCTGLIIAVIIFSGCRWKEFMRIPYAVWTVICIVGGGYAIQWGRINYLYFGQWVTAVLNVAVYGYLALRIFIRIVWEKKIPRMNWGTFILWVAMAGQRK